MTKFLTVKAGSLVKRILIKPTHKPRRIVLLSHLFCLFRIFRSVKIEVTSAATRDNSGYESKT